MDSPAPCGTPDQYNVPNSNVQVGWMQHGRNVVYFQLIRVGSAVRRARTQGGSHRCQSGSAGGMAAGIAVSNLSDTRDIFYFWRPYLQDPKDDMILELVVEAEYIVTCNLRDFTHIQTFEIEAITPQQLLDKIGATS